MRPDRDTFVFVGNFGHDTINNYSAGKDRIEFDRNQFPNGVQKRQQTGRQRCRHHHSRS
jgi:hypothetical protein